MLSADPDYTRAHTVMPDGKEPASTCGSKTKYCHCLAQLNVTALTHKTDGIERCEVLQIKSKTELLNIHSEL